MSLLFMNQFKDHGSNFELKSIMSQPPTIVFIRPLSLNTLPFPPCSACDVLLFGGLIVGDTF